MEDVFGRLGEILRPQFDLLNEAERNGDDIIVKKIVDDIFEIDDYVLLPTDKIPVMKTIIYDTDDPLVKAIKSEIQQTKDNG